MSTVTERAHVNEGQRWRRGDLRIEILYVENETIVIEVAPLVLM